MGSPTIGYALGQSISFLGQIAFKWIPATFIAVTGTGGPDVASPTIGYISNPITVPQAVDYLQMASAPGLWDRLFYNWSVFVALSLFASLLLIALIIYCIIRIQQIRYIETVHFAAAKQVVTIEDVPKSHLRWRRILEQMQTEDDQSWRLAILEADIMLNELLDRLGYKGEAMGDKMKRVDRADFRTIDFAWEAHKFRNMIAHEGTAARLDKRDAERILGMYQRVFREFHFVE
jgi:hypothetical protein